MKQEIFFVCLVAGALNLHLAVTLGLNLAFLKIEVEALRRRTVTSLYFTTLTYIATVAGIYQPELANSAVYWSYITVAFIAINNIQAKLLGEIDGS